ncbi:FtsX-like permease family protein [Pedobacter metabolipauper]|uniref:FtsX-like permease family protein n=1 Tax=Pedobacter metabolipauper TaxID=425513 RepID=UPI001AAE0E1D|nr:FtsX-like permease family protein [Pedobacter metabolipauper]
MAAGLSGFMIILLYINFETGYDKWDPSLKNTYQVGLHQVKNGAANSEAKTDGFFVKMIREQFPEVHTATMWLWSDGFKVNYFYNHQSYEQNFTAASIDSLFLKTYPLQAIYGDIADVFKDKRGIAISLGKAREMFGNADPINQVILKKGGANFSDEQLVVKAVWDEKKYRSYFNIDFISAIDFNIYGSELWYRNYNVMLQFNEKTDVRSAIVRINQLYLQDQAKRAMLINDPNYRVNSNEAMAILKKKEGITSQRIVIEPVEDLNMKSFFSQNPKQKSIYILTALASFLLIISCVNFTNLAIVQAGSRAKEVGIKKVLGAFRTNLTLQFLIETGMQCLLAFFIALITVELMLPPINSILDTQLILFNGTELSFLIGQGLSLLIVIVLLSGLYPALFLSRFAPAKVLKGNFATSFGSVNLRKSLMVLQFTIAGSLVISFLIMNAQLNYMKNKDLGMEANQVMALGIRNFKNRSLNPAEFSSIRQRLMGIDGVEDISRSTDGLVGESNWKHDFTYNGKTSELITKYNDINYLNLLKAKIVMGRGFSEKLMATDTLTSIVLNEAAFIAMNLKEINVVIDLKDGDRIQHVNVVGVVKNIQNEGFDRAIKPAAYLAGDFKWHWRSVVLLRLRGSNIAETITNIKNVWKEIEPDGEPRYSFANEKFAKLNAVYERMASVMFAFSTITLLVSVMGLFTLAAYSSKLRLKEIAIRKILGASTISILKLLNVDLVRLVVAANIFADVFAYIYMNHWFKDFVYRIDIPFMPFLLVNIATIVLTIITVSIQSVSAVKANPVRALKYE